MADSVKSLSRVLLVTRLDLFRLVAFLDQLLPEENDVSKMFLHVLVSIPMIMIKSLL